MSAGHVSCSERRSPDEFCCGGIPESRIGLRRRDFDTTTGLRDACRDTARRLRRVSPSFLHASATIASDSAAEAEQFIRNNRQNALATARISHSLADRIASGPIMRTQATIADSGARTRARSTRLTASRSRSLLDVDMRLSDLQVTRTKFQDRVWCPYPIPASVQQTTPQRSVQAHLARSCSDRHRILGPHRAVRNR